MGKVAIFEMSGSAMESAVARQTGPLEVVAAPRDMSFKVERWKAASSSKLTSHE